MKKKSTKAKKVTKSQQHNNDAPLVNQAQELPAPELKSQESAVVANVVTPSLEQEKVEVSSFFDQKVQAAEQLSHSDNEEESRGGTISTAQSQSREVSLIDKLAFSIQTA